MLTRNEFKKLPIFITSMSRWDGDISSASIALAKVFSQTNPVYYIDYPYSWADIWRERKLVSLKRRMPALLQGKQYLVNVSPDYPGLLGATPRPVIPAYSLQPGPFYDRVMDYNDGRVAALIKKIIKQHSLGDYLLINSFNPFYLANIEKYLNPLLSVYHSRDAIEEVSLKGLLKENECVQHYDLSMATSLQLCRNIGERNNQLINYFPNGGDINLFKTAITEKLPKPTELQDIHTKIIGYTGAVCQRVDYELLVKLAEANHDKTIVLVGPRKDKTFTNIDLDKYSNIVFTGPRKIEELPAYLQYFDCTIIPFVKNNLTGGIYPLKINEYLAAGKPVVTTNFSEDIESFRNHLYLADTHDQFLQQVNLAIDDNSAERQVARLQAAEVNSWHHRLELFWQLAWEAYAAKNRIKSLVQRHAALEEHNHGTRHGSFKS